MKYLNLTAIIFILAVLPALAGKKEAEPGIAITNWLYAGPVELSYPAFSNVKNQKNEVFSIKNLLEFREFEFKKILPREGQRLLNDSSSAKWEILKAGKDGFASGKLSGKAMYSSGYYSTYIKTDRWTKASISIQSHSLAEVWLDGEKLTVTATEPDPEKNEPVKAKADVKLAKGTHTLIIKAIAKKGNNIKIEAKITPAEGFSEKSISLALNPEFIKTIYNIVDGVKVSSVSLSADGKYYAISYSESKPPTDQTSSWTEISLAKDGRLVRSFKNTKSSSFNWAPKSSRLAFRNPSGDDAADIIIYDPEKNTETKVLEGIKDLGGVNWSPEESFLIYSIEEKPDTKTAELLTRVENPDDRQPGWKNRSFLYKLDLKSGMKYRITYGNISTDLNDISRDGKYLLFSTSTPDFTVRPFSKNNLYMLELESLTIDTIWSNKLWSGGCSFSPDGAKLLVIGSPSTFGSIGERNHDKKMVNNYFKSAYIYDMITKKADPITLDFRPSIQNARWLDASTIWFSTEDGEYSKLYKYDIKSRAFSKIETSCDVMASFDIDTAGKVAVYTGSSISTPRKAFLLDLASQKAKVIAEPETETYKYVKFGRTEDWTFKNVSGIEIAGRVYYPPDFDSSKSYPLIVYYYGGTSPVGRSFGGRYPFNLFAGNGYVVYVLQPSGATGFGQEFANEHVNNWGETVADEIIKGTKEFLAAHKFVDPKRIGCMGASYGGFLTMLLQTRTDMFTTAISHAGISSISSYWGEGYWGYVYSAEASADSYPWNNKKLYIDQSPLFNADKVKTPMLLLHGSVDTNVPIGESIQFFTALKILGKEVEFVKINGSDHIVNARGLRIQWENSIMAWFDRWLMNQPEWWYDMYPKGNN